MKKPLLDTECMSIRGLGLTQEQQKAVGFLAVFAERMVLLAFEEGRTPAGASNLIQEVYRVTDEMIAGCLRSGAKLPCKMGCSWCCYLRVKATPLEVLCMADYLRAGLEPGELAELQQRLVRTDGITRGMDGYRRVCAKMVCPVLFEGKCLAYAVRPMACRVYHSLNVSDCKASLDDVDCEVRIRRDITCLSMGIFAGLTVGLRAVGLHPRLLELTAGLRIAMDAPGNDLAKMWLSGEPAFLEAEIEDAQKVEHVYQALMEELGDPISRGDS